MLMLLLVLLALTLMLIMRGVLKLSTDMRGGQGDGQLLVLEAARCHDGGNLSALTSFEQKLGFRRSFQCFSLDFHRRWDV